MQYQLPVLSCANSFYHNTQHYGLYQIAYRGYCEEFDGLPKSFQRIVVRGHGVNIEMRKEAGPRKYLAVCTFVVDVAKILRIQDKIEMKSPIVLHPQEILSVEMVRAQIAKSEIFLATRSMLLDHSRLAIANLVKLRASLKSSN